MNQTDFINYCLLGLGSLTIPKLCYTVYPTACGIIFLIIPKNAKYTLNGNLFGVREDRKTLDTFKLRLAWEL